MGIVTKTGDKGSTSLCCGTKVDKDDIRMEICGSLDEVSSFLGMAKACAGNDRTKSVAARVQRSLIALNAEVTSTTKSVNRLKERICRDSVRAIEKEIACLEDKCGLKTRVFCLQGANVVSSTLDIARAITRRAERRCVTLMKRDMLNNRDIIVYLNRLSDLLYLLARFNEKK